MSNFASSISGAYLTQLAIENSDMDQDVRLAAENDFLNKLKENFIKTISKSGTISKGFDFNTGVLFKMIHRFRSRLRFKANIYNAAAGL